MTRRPRPGRLLAVRDACRCRPRISRAIGASSLEMLLINIERAEVAYRKVTRRRYG